MKKEVWNTLSKIDVTNFSEKKGPQGGLQLDYLSWGGAWSLLMEHFPDSHHVDLEPNVYPDGSMEVSCTITVDNTSRSMWLPVMDHSNKAILNPNSRAISDSKMRCLVKCLTLFGLGMELYLKTTMRAEYRKLTTSTDSQVTVDDSPNPSQRPSGGDESHILYNDNLIMPCGKGEGKLYSDMFNNDLEKVQKSIDYWSPRKRNDTQTLHLKTLEAYARSIECSAVEGVA